MLRSTEEEEESFFLLSRRQRDALGRKSASVAEFANICDLRYALFHSWA